ncbi:MAG: cyclic nucleotide-binding domain-containing protein [Candidatus Wallbacteria bacterium]|nr:cyclic nucleotide-binding domain-containing protein [Candidatus Wallbacteria bacterium]
MTDRMDIGGSWVTPARLVGYLSGLRFFEGIGPEELSRLEPLLRAVCIPAGVTLFREGDPALDLYFVIEGRVAIAHVFPGREPLRIGHAGKGELFGWSAVVPPHEETATAETVEPTIAVVLEGRALRALCDADDKLALFFARRLNLVLAARLHAVRAEVFGLMSRLPAR